MQVTTSPPPRSAGEGTAALFTPSPWFMIWTKLRTGEGSADVAVLLLMRFQPMASHLYVTASSPMIAGWEGCWQLSDMSSDSCLGTSSGETPATAPSRACGTPSGEVLQAALVGHCKTLGGQRTDFAPCRQGRCSLTWTAFTAGVWRRRTSAPMSSR